MSGVFSQLASQPGFFDKQTGSGQMPTAVDLAFGGWGGAPVDYSKMLSDVKAPDVRIPGMGGMGGGGGLGFNMGTANLALSGLGTIGSLWAAFEQNALAKKQFNYTKQLSDTNLANQIQSYNTALADKARSRAVMEGQSQESADAWVDKNKMTGMRG